MFLYSFLHSNFKLKVQGHELESLCTTDPEHNINNSPKQHREIELIRKMAPGTQVFENTVVGVPLTFHQKDLYRKLYSTPKTISLYSFTLQNFQTLRISGLVRCSSQH